MKNLPYRLGFKSVFVLTFLFSYISGYASEVAKNAKASSNVEAAQQAGVAETVFKVATKGAPTYFINEKENPELTLKRGITYSFELKTTGHPFWIKTKNSTGKTNVYEAGVTGNGTERGTLSFAVPADAPALLHYNCEVHDMMNGTIHIAD